MATKIICTCDMCGGDAKNEKRRIPVTFLSEQTEGKYCKPYLTYADMELCDTCYEIVIDKQPVVGIGAQGYNRYSWKKYCDN